MPVWTLNALGLGSKLVDADSTSVLGDVVKKTFGFKISLWRYALSKKEIMCFNAPIGRCDPDVPIFLSLKLGGGQSSLWTSVLNINLDEGINLVQPAATSTCSCSDCQHLVQHWYAMNHEGRCVGLTPVITSTHLFDCQDFHLANPKTGYFPLPTSMSNTNIKLRRSLKREIGGLMAQAVMGDANPLSGLMSEYCDEWEDITLIVSKLIHKQQFLVEVKPEKPLIEDEFYVVSYNTPDEPADGFRAGAGNSLIAGTIHVGFTARKSA